MIEPFTIRETQLVHRLGLTREELKAQRSTLIKGVDWEFKERGAIYWTAVAVDKVLANLQLKNAPAASVSVSTLPQPAPDNNGAPRTPTDAHSPQECVLEELTVVRWKIPNRFVIQARRSNGDVVPVRVKDNSKFREKMSDGRPMKLQARRQAGQWTLAQPGPRWPGKW